MYRPTLDGRFLLYRSRSLQVSTIVPTLIILKFDPINMKLLIQVLSEPSRGEWNPRGPRDAAAALSLGFQNEYKTGVRSLLPNEVMSQTI